MTRVSYLENLKRHMEGVERDMQAARQKIESGAAVDKVSASGELAALEAQHRELMERMDHAIEHHSDEWSPLHTEFQRDVDALTDAMERWIDQYPGARVVERERE
ncbi:hypothetical protein [Rhodobium gokarnense]|uniref:Uncharacterized protein n=1 Tax=Rhodobium gokarnense TaxID=364296 RepID=A0ABT3H8D2_9HYPH|nr:hypothetical protein [Rhodobium gokarnense]MCW2306660.1 hypothetical protein [Rhodobium gokarnense]